MSTKIQAARLHCERSEQETVLLYSEILRAGIDWRADNEISQTAKALIRAGWLDRHGNISLQVFEL
jgi:hypothetical protein